MDEVRVKLYENKLTNKQRKLIKKAQHVYKVKLYRIWEVLTFRHDLVYEFYENRKDYIRHYIYEGDLKLLLEKGE